MLLLVVLLSACSGGVNFTPVSTASPSTPGAVLLSLTSVSFTATGAANAQSVSASEADYGGSFSASTAAAGQPNSCSGIATIASTGATAFAVTPVAAGSCSFTIGGATGQSATLAVTVTVTNFGGS